jgi:pSer/pThr/pTyr-binding forkhead associated (FHA) protein
MEVELTEVGPSTRRIVLDTLPVMIGQAPDAGVRLDDHLVSRIHCEINAVKGTLVVRDLGSMLGTFVNGLNVATALLMPGDKLTVGITSFLVQYEVTAASMSLPEPVEAPAAFPEPVESAKKKPGRLPRLIALLRPRNPLHLLRRRSPR